MNSHQNPDLFYDHAVSRSPGSHRHPQPTLHRQPSRQFDAYGQIALPQYVPEDQNHRYDPTRFDRLNSSQNGAYGFEPPMSQTWNANSFGGNPAFSFGATGRMKPSTRGRSHIPPAWLDQQASPIPSLSPFGGMGHSAAGGSQLRTDSFPHESEEELIPTAIVIKNIPFAVKKESLVELMTHMNLPLPYAFNYHFDGGIFRGLAFANFTSPDETATVIQHLNHFELQGRKLRVEYKKMLPAQERERIEREKRERRGQLEEQHRPQGTPGLQNQHSMSSLSSHIPATSPSPVSARNSGKDHYDLNDPQVLGFYTQLAIFKQNEEQESLVFPSSLTPSQRRIVHTLAHHMQLSHVSQGNGDQRRVHVLRATPGSNISPPIPPIPALHNDPSRRVLNRSATTDFSEARNNDAAIFGTLRGQHSTGYLGVPDSPSGFGAQQNLRGAKSYADLRSYTPSPAQSSASFPVAAMQSNIARFTDIAQSGVASATPTLTPTTSGGTLGQQRDEALLVNGFGNMSIGNNATSGMNARLRGMMAWEEAQGPTTAPIGSNRNLGMTNYDDSLRDRREGIPMRQPRGPAVERGPGFSRGRQNGHQARGSDELRHQSSNVEIIVE